MQHTLSDTHPDIDRMQMAALRRLSEADRLSMAFQLSAQVWELGRQAFVDRYAEAEPKDQQFHFLAAQYGEELACRWRAATSGRTGRSQR